MKKMIFSFLVTMTLASFAQAGVLLKSSTGGGMPGPNGPFFNTMEITDRGVVQIKDQTGSYQVSKLSKNALATLKLQIEKMKVEPMQRPPQGTPACMDAPSTSVTVTKADGTEIEIFEEVGCLESKMPSGFYLTEFAENLRRAANFLTQKD